MNDFHEVCSGCRLAENCSRSGSANGPVPTNVDYSSFGPIQPKHPSKCAIMIASTITAEAKAKDKNEAKADNVGNSETHTFKYQGTSIQMVPININKNIYIDDSLNLYVMTHEGDMIKVPERVNNEG